jgi:ATP-dependent DNA helicase RecQ
VDPKILYEVQIQHAKLDPVIKLLLRTYGGNLFSEYLRIQEVKLAKTLGIKEPELVKALEQLAKMDVLDYDRKKDRPQLTFLTERFDAGTLPLNFQRIQLRKELAFSKATQMVTYASQTRLCRTQYIQEYFGEQTDQACGVCDCCLAQKKAKIAQEAEYQMKEKLLETLAHHGELGEQELFDSINKPASVAHLNCLRLLVEEGKVITVVQGRYKLSTNG